MVYEACVKKWDNKREKWDNKCLEIHCVKWS